MFGGAWATPIACRRIESTVTMKGKQVTMIARPGARLRSVTSRKSCTVRRLNDWPSPRSIEISCASAGCAEQDEAEHERSGCGPGAAIARIGQFPDQVM